MLSGSFTIPEWDPAAITDVLERLTPRNCQVRRVREGERGTDGLTGGERERGTREDSGGRGRGRGRRGGGMESVNGYNSGKGY